MLPFTTYSTLGYLAQFLDYMQSSPKAIFLLYAADAAAIAGLLQTKLTSLKPEGQIGDIQSMRITANSQLHELPKYTKHIAEADLVVVLLSPKLLASQSLAIIEQDAYRIYYNPKRHLIPVLAHPCDWITSSLSRHLILPQNEVPISKWNDPTDAISYIAGRLVYIAHDLQQSDTISIARQPAFALLRASFLPARKAAPTSAFPDIIATSIPKSSSPTREVEISPPIAMALPDDGSMQGDVPTQGDVVEATLFAPAHAAPAESILIQIWAHTEADADKVHNMATAFDEEAEARSTDTLENTVQKGDKLTFTLIIKNLPINDAQQTLTWRGRAAAVQYQVDLPTNLAMGNLVGRVNMQHNGVPTGFMLFKVEIVSSSAAPIPTSTPPLSTEVAPMVRYQKAFIAAAEEDRKAVSARLQLLDKLKISYVQSPFAPEPTNFIAIDNILKQTDLFLLFWSKNAAKSLKVVQETLQAIALKKARPNYEIIPVVLELPAAAAPNSLASLNFSESTLFADANPPQIKILFLAANPTDTGRLRLDEEQREIGESLRRAKKRDSFLLETRTALRSRDMQRALLDNEPQIVHFSGHGTDVDSPSTTTFIDNTRGLTWKDNKIKEFSGGIILENSNGKAQQVSSRTLSSLFKKFSDTVQCVLLNSCYSQNQAEAIAKHIPFVIGMKTALPDTTALAFSAGFYDALGAGRDIKTAFEMAIDAVKLAGVGGDDIPILLEKKI